jgi:hypothetical protein
MAKYIGNIPSVGEFKKLDSLTSTFNGSLTQFDLEYGSTSVSVGDASQLIVSLNGIIQEPLTAYTLAVGGSAIVFSSAPASTDTCHIILLGGVGGTSTVSDGAVTAAKLDAGLKDYLEETYTANGSQTTYALTRAPIGTNDLMITIDGIVQPSTAYSIAGTTLTISPALPNGTDVRVVHMGVRAGFVVPSSSSITAAMFQDFTTDVKFNDNAKAVFGTGDDLQIYHSGTQSIISDVGSGNLNLEGDSKIVLRSTGGSENYAQFFKDGAVELYYDNSVKLATTATGIEITQSGNNVGLLVTGGGYNYTAKFESSDAEANIIIEDSNSTNNGNMIGVATNDMYFITNNAERMRIDSSGNLLVGKTSANSNAVGIELHSNDIIKVTRSGGATGYFNRQTSDGSILELAKDGTTVGSIGVQSTDQLYIATPDGSGVGLIFDGDNRKIDPTDGAGSNLDNAVDLGTGAYRFKDLYLSGGVYLGGTGSANKLDDYEEGTCTITIKDSSNNSATMGINVFRYVKIGSLVHLTGTLQWSSTSALNTSRIQIHGLPFTSASSASGGTNRSPVSNGTSTSGSFTIPREEIAFGIDPNATFIWGSRATGNNYDDILTKSHLGTSGVLYSLQAIYETDA